MWYEYAFFQNISNLFIYFLLDPPKGEILLRIIGSRGMVSLGIEVFGVFTLVFLQKVRLFENKTQAYLSTAISALRLIYFLILHTYFNNLSVLLSCSPN